MGLPGAAELSLNESGAPLLTLPASERRDSDPGWDFILFYFFLAFGAASGPADREAAAAVALRASVERERLRGAGTWLTTKSRRGGSTVLAAAKRWQVTAESERERGGGALCEGVGGRGGAVLSLSGGPVGVCLFVFQDQDFPVPCSRWASERGSRPGAGCGRRDLSSVN